MADDDGSCVILAHGDAAEDLGITLAELARLVDLGHLVEVPIGDYGETMVRDDETMQRLRRDLVAVVEAGRCPTCRASLTAPERSPEGWRHCRACRRGWRIDEGPRGRRPVRREW
jgi:hypothetical protein